MIKTRALTSELFHDRGSVLPSRGFEWTVVALSTWLMAGAYLDAWAHRHLARLETFYTPWHAVLYSGMLALLIYLAASPIGCCPRGMGSRWLGAPSSGSAASSTCSGTSASASRSASRRSSVHRTLS